jgi:riboflavin kinase/FMN adenylyltransferase
MPVERELAAATPARPSIITIGVFDGVHLGHQALLRRLVEEAARQELISVVVTFRQHPLKLLFPGQAPLYIASPPDNIRQIKELGVDLVVAITFDAELAGINAQTFVLMLQHFLKMKGLILGWDFAMGAHREGTLSALNELGTKLGFTTEIVPAVKVNGEVVSSTAIRQALQEGDVVRAGAMLGRPFSLEGRVVTGAGRGAGLGFPTANLDIDPSQILPADGVYAARARIKNASSSAAIFIGACPTFGRTERTIEAHLLDFAGDIYRETMRVDIIERLRGIERFGNTDALREQVARDIMAAEEVLKTGTDDGTTNYKTE